MSSSTDTTRPVLDAPLKHPVERPSESPVLLKTIPFLTAKDMTILFVIILFFVTNISNAAAGGAAGLALWAIGGLFFLLPCGIATAQLGVVFPYEGSIYSWTYRTFGNFMGFFVGFAAWVPGSLLILATDELVVNLIQGLNQKWLAAPWQQGVVLVVTISASSFFAVQRQRIVQYMVNITFALILLATMLVFVSGLFWLAHGQHSATDFSQGAGWNPFTATNIPLFGVITLGYLGVNLPLNLAGEIFSRRSDNEKEKRKLITGHLLWGSLIVLVCYLLSTFGVLVVQGQNASFVLFAPVSTVNMALGKIAGDVTAVCIIVTLVVAAICYNVVFARFLMVGGMDRRIPKIMGQLNHNRVPGNAILLQTILACVLAVLFFMVIPYIGIMSASPTHLAASFYFVVVGTATVLWAFATLFLFINLLRLMIRQPQLLRRHQILPGAILYLSCLVGLLVGVAAIIDTVLNSYDPPDIPNNLWLLFVAGLTLVILILGSIGGMFWHSQASFEAMEEDAVS